MDKGQRAKNYAALCRQLRREIDRGEIEEAGLVRKICVFREKGEPVEVIALEADLRDKMKTLKDLRAELARAEKLLEEDVNGTSANS